MSYERKAFDQLMTKKRAKKRKYKGDAPTLQNFLNNNSTELSEFLRLNSKWYNKLRKSGFTDIEFYDPRTGIGQNSANMKGCRDAKYLQRHIGNEEYFRRARAFLHICMFSCKLDKLLWTQFSDGVSFREMARTAKQRFYRNHIRTYATARRRVMRYFPLWFAYNAEQSKLDTAEHPGL